MCRTFVITINSIRSVFEKVIIAINVLSLHKYKQKIVQRHQSYPAAVLAANRMTELFMLNGKDDVFVAIHLADLIVTRARLASITKEDGYSHVLLHNINFIHTLHLL